MSEQLGEVANSRSAAQAAAMQASIDAGICRFCTLDRTINKPEHDYECNMHWYAMRNAWPYDYLNKPAHIVMPSIEHLTKLDQISGYIAQSFFKLNLVMVNRFRLPGGAIVLRAGDFKHHAGTMKHLHGQIQTPDLTGPAFVTIGKGNEMQLEETIEMLMGGLTHKPCMAEIKLRPRPSSSSRRPPRLRSFHNKTRPSARCQTGVFICYT